MVLKHLLINIKTSDAKPNYLTRKNTSQSVGRRKKIYYNVHEQLTYDRMTDATQRLADLAYVHFDNDNAETNNDMKHVEGL